jgi:5-methylcytosine-specific restriction endonuclease McrA
MQRVFVLDTNKRPLTPCRPARARQLLSEGKAAVFRRYPFTIILKAAKPEAVAAPVRVKIDPGAKTTGLALVSECSGEVMFAAELTHRGAAIRDNLTARRTIRHGRRSRKTRYRKARFLNRAKSKGWLAPSLQHRVETVMTWVERFRRFAPIATISQELVRFDMQAMQNLEISGVGYQQGELAGFEIREALLEKWGRACAYCGVCDVPLQVEHIHPKARGGSNRFSNLTLACEDCNQRKGALPVEVFLADRPQVLAWIKAQARKPLDAAAAVNATRWALHARLKATGLPVETGSGVRTKFNRTRLDLPKAHWIDAACVGASGSAVHANPETKPLAIKATGHGKRQMCGTDKFGFPIRHRTNKVVHFGFRTGDMVKAVVTKGKKTGVHKGRVLCRATGSFDIATINGRVAGVSHKYFSHTHRKDGYAYA